MTTLKAMPLAAALAIACFAAAWANEDRPRNEILDAVDWQQIGQEIVGRWKGSQRADRLMGRDQDDHVWGRWGDDWIWGKGGDDRIQGQRGNDQIWGGAGDDRLWGGHGNDRIRGGSGNDLLNGDLGNDRLRGGSGNDMLFGGPGDDVLLGEGGDDWHFGGPGADSYGFTLARHAWALGGKPFIDGNAGWPSGTRESGDDFFVYDDQDAVPFLGRLPHYPDRWSAKLKSIADVPMWGNGQVTLDRSAFEDRVFKLRHRSGANAWFLKLK